MTTIINLSAQRKGPGCVASVLWYLCIGWWASFLAVLLAWLCMLTLVGIPLGVALINKLPKIVALREPGNGGLQIIVANGATIITNAGVRQHSFLVRALYFVCLGWWLSMIVMLLGWACCATLVGMPLGFWLFDKTPGLLSLHR